jgi:hypothetical protein
LRRRDERPAGRAVRRRAIRAQPRPSSKTAKPTGGLARGCCMRSSSALNAAPECDRALLPPRPPRARTVSPRPAIVTRSARRASRRAAAAPARGLPRAARSSATARVMASACATSVLAQIATPVAASTSILANSLPRAAWGAISPIRPAVGMSAFCAQPTAGVDVKRSWQNVRAR